MAAFGQTHLLVRPVCIKVARVCLITAVLAYLPVSWNGPFKVKVPHLRWAADERPQLASRDLAYLRKRKLDMDSAFDAACSPGEQPPS